MQTLELYHPQNHPSTWNLVTDQVMGGLSTAQLKPSEVGLQLSGEVSLENHGGFIQIQHPIDRQHCQAELFQGVYLELSAQKSQEVALLIKSSQLWMPWQSYRYTVNIGPQAALITVPFEAFQPYRTQTQLNPKRINKFAILVGGEAQTAQLTLHQFGLYR